MSTKLLWWGYLHTSGTIQVKRCFDPRDLEDAYESPFVRFVVAPFPAEGREDAIRYVEQEMTKYNLKPEENANS